MTEEGKKIERTKIPIALIRVLNDKDTEPVNEVKFSDGSKEEKRYHIELKSRDLTESCDKLTGKIRVMDINGQTITLKIDGQTIKPEDAGYFPPDYDLAFSLSEGKCIVKIIDTTDGGIKEKFITSNRLAIALKDNPEPVDLSNIAVLYGGVGNIIEIDINSAKKEVPIEPVGIIVIGIDGLRQDVLYPAELDAVQDGGQYRIDITNLTGLKQILTGNPQVPEAQHGQN